MAVRVKQRKGLDMLMTQRISIDANRSWVSSRAVGNTRYNVRPRNIIAAIAFGIAAYSVASGDVVSGVPLFLTVFAVRHLLIARQATPFLQNPTVKVQWGLASPAVPVLR